MGTSISPCGKPFWASLIFNFEPNYTRVSPTVMLVLGVLQERYSPVWSRPPIKLINARLPTKTEEQYRVL